MLQLIYQATWAMEMPSTQRILFDGQEDVTFEEISELRKWQNWHPPNSQLNGTQNTKTQGKPVKGSKTINCAAEELIKQARKDYKLGVYKTVKAAADAYKVSYPTLVQCVNVQTPPKYIVHKHQLILTTKKEEVLMDWLKFLAMSGHPVNQCTLHPKVEALIPES